MDLFLEEGLLESLEPDDSFKGDGTLKLSSLFWLSLLQFSSLLSKLSISFVRLIGLMLNLMSVRGAV